LIRVPSNKVLVVFIDLDDTITTSKINNTYHFIKLFYKIRGDIARLLLYEFVIRIMLFINKVIYTLRMLLKLSNTSSTSMDTILLSILFVGYNVELLKEFSIKWVYSLLKLRLFNEKILRWIRFLKGNGAKLVLLTACTELPACVIAKYLGFDTCFARRFITKWSIVMGMKDVESIPILKLKNIIKFKKMLSCNNVCVVYIVDKTSASVEQQLFKTKMFDYVIVV